MNNKIIKSILAAFLISLTIILMNCKGDQGDPGPAATPGTAGKDGKDGADGVDGVAYDDAVSRGGFIVSLSGKRPDGAAFTASLDFKFSSTNKDNSSFYRQKAKSDSTDYFNIGRFTDFNYANDDYDAASYLAVDPVVDALGDTSLNVSLDLTASIRSSSDNKYFDLGQDHYWFSKSFDDTGVSSLGGNLKSLNSAVFSFDSVKGNFIFKSSFVVPAANNGTGYDLKVSIDANATVTESYQNINWWYGAERVAASQRKTLGPVTQAVMKSY